MAKKGDKAMIKLFLEMFVSKAPQVEEQAEGVQKIGITIHKLDTLNTPTVIDVTPEKDTKEIN